MYFVLLNLSHSFQNFSWVVLAEKFEVHFLQAHISLSLLLVSIMYNKFFDACLDFRVGLQKHGVEVLELSLRSFLFYKTSQKLLMFVVEFLIDE